MSEESACPECGGKVRYDLTCHTYEQGGRWCACMPCDSAIEYLCAAQYDDEPGECEWRYTHGLNPRNPRAAENEKRRPPWLPPGLSVMQDVPAGGPGSYPLVLAKAVRGVALIGSDD